MKTPQIFSTISYITPRKIDVLLNIGKYKQLYIAVRQKMAYSIWR